MTKQSNNAGNMTTGYTPEGYPLTMTYDAQNRMKTAEYTDGTGKVNLFEYAYAGTSLLDQMVKKENGSPVSATKYVRSGFLPFQERDASNAITREYTWGKNLGGGIGGLLNLKQGGQDYSYLYDGKGNVSALLNSGTQAVVASYAYDPFGQQMKETSTIDQPYRFSTKELQGGTGQYYYGYRFYDSCSGKWPTRDPLGEAGGMNLYRAMGNAPNNWRDPFGLYEEDVHYYKTIEWALKSGIDSRIAVRIAAADQKVDDNIFSNPKYWPINLVLGGKFYFQTREYAYVGLGQALDTGNIEQFGMFLHILQDSYSHEGYYLTLMGHFFDTVVFGKNPDRYMCSSKRDTEMREDTMKWLKLFENKIGRGYHSIIRREQ